MLRAVLGDEQRRAFCLGLRLRGRIVSGGVSSAAIPRARHGKARGMTRETRRERRVRASHRRDTHRRHQRGRLRRRHLEDARPRVTPRGCPCRFARGKVGVGRSEERFRVTSKFFEKFPEYRMNDNSVPCDKRAAESRDDANPRDRTYESRCTPDRIHAVPVPSHPRRARALFVAGSSAKARMSATGPSRRGRACAKHPNMATIANRPCLISPVFCTSKPSASSASLNGSNGAPPSNSYPREVHPHRFERPNAPRQPRVPPVPSHQHRLTQRDDRHPCFPAITNPPKVK